MGDDDAVPAFGLTRALVSALSLGLFAVSFSCISDFGFSILFSSCRSRVFLYLSVHHVIKIFLVFPQVLYGKLSY